MGKPKNNLFIIILLSIFILTKLLAAFKFHDIRWDEAVFIGMGKYIYSLGKIGIWETFRPIGMPILLGFFWKLGLNIILTAEIISILFASGCLLLIYLIGEEIFDQKTAIIASLLLFLTPLFFYYPSYAFSGIPSTFFALLSFYFFIKKNIVYTGIFAAISFLFRFPQGIMLISFLLIIWLYNLRSTILPKKGIKLSIIYLITLLPFFIFNYILYGIKGILKPLMDGVKHQSNIAVSVVIKGNLQSYFYNFFYYLIELLKENILLIFFLLGIFFFFKNKDYNNKKITSLFIIFTLFLTYFTLIINKQIRFSLAFLPYLCLISSYGLLKTLNILKNKKKFFTILIILLSMIPITTIIEQQNWRTAEEPTIYSDFYKFYFKTDSYVLTTTPTHIAYSDTKMIPFYNNVDDAVEIYTKNKEKAKIIIYSSEFYPCFDQICIDKKNWLFTDINSTSTLLFHQKYDQDYYIYLNNDLK